MFTIQYNVPFDEWNSRNSLCDKKTCLSQFSFCRALSSSLVISLLPDTWGESENNKSNWNVVTLCGIFPQRVTAFLTYYIKLSIISDIAKIVERLLVQTGKKEMYFEYPYRYFHQLRKVWAIKIFGIDVLEC